EFNAEDWRRRTEWGKVSAKAADALCVSGSHRCDWDPHSVHVEPLVQKAKAGDTLRCTLVVENALKRPLTLKVTVRGGPAGVADQEMDVQLPASGVARRPLPLTLPANLSAGRHICTVEAREGTTLDGSDAFLAIDVGE